MFKSNKFWMVLSTSLIFSAQMSHALESWGTNISIQTGSLGTTSGLSSSFPVSSNVSPATNEFLPVMWQGVNLNNSCSSISSFTLPDEGGLAMVQSVLSSSCGALTYASGYNGNYNNNSWAYHQLSNATPFFFAIYASAEPNEQGTYYMQPLLSGVNNEGSGNISALAYYGGVQNIFLNSSPDSSNASFGLSYPGIHSGGLGRNGTNVSKYTSNFAQNNLFRATCNMGPNSYAFTTDSTGDTPPAVQAQCAEMSFYTNSTNPLPNVPSYSGEQTLVLSQLLPGAILASNSVGDFSPVPPGNYGNSNNQCNIDYYNANNFMQLTCGGPAPEVARARKVRGQLQEVTFLVDLTPMVNLVKTINTSTENIFIYVDNDGNGNYTVTYKRIYAALYPALTPTLSSKYVRTK